MLRTIASLVFGLSLWLASCGAAGPAIDQDRAIEIAREAGSTNGYDPAVYTEASATWEEEDGSWWVLIEHAPPAPPGGHFGVRVDGTTGEATLRHGE
jgi:hypothetical protein